MNISKFIEELKRRNVFRVATAYAIAGWLIIQVFATVAPQLGFPEWIAPFVTILVLIGFPLALIFAWAFELTPDGIQKSNEVEITESVTESTGKKLNKIIISTLGILVILLLSERIFFAESTIFDADKLNVESASIAVLPFVNMSDDRSNEYFSDGLSEELLNALAKVEDMKVAARTSSFKFKGQNENLKLIGDELGVSHILEGSVRRAGNQVRITAQLIKVDDGFHLWSETFDRELTVNNVFAIQEEISRTVLTELKVQLLPEEAEAMAALPTQDIEAYNLYLEATQLEPSRRPEELEQAIEKYKQAIAIDPNFALAHARLAIAYTLLGDYGNIQYEEMISEAQYYSDQTFLLDPNLGEGFLAKAFVQSRVIAKDREKNAEETLRKAIDILPNSAMAYNALQISVRDQGRDEEADTYLLKAFELDPLSSPISSNVAGYYLNEKNFDKAIEIADANIARDPDFTATYMVKLDALRLAPNAQLVEAFKFIYNLDKSRPGDLRFMRSVNLEARDLDLLPVAEYKMLELQRTFPNNFDIYFNLISTNHLLEKSAENVEILTQLRQRFGAASLRPSVAPMVFSYSSLRKYQEIVQEIESNFPEVKAISFTEEDLGKDENGNSNIENLMLYYGGSLIKLGRVEDAQPYADWICKYYGIDELEGDYTSWNNEKLAEARACSALRIDGKAVADYNRELYFERRARLGWPEYFVVNIRNHLVEDHPDIQAVQKEIMDDLHRQRTEVIEWLKTEGEWREEWEVGSGN